MQQKTNPKTVLVVDDDAEYLNFLSIAVGTVHEVISATSGEEALRKARIAKPDAIVMDVMMPGGQDGFSTFCDLGKDPATRRIPVIILSSVSRVTGAPFDKESIAQYLGSAPFAFLEKPVSPDVLLAELDNALGVESTERSKHRG
jgi:CheY-like chemotaxis protein